MLSERLGEAVAQWGPFDDAIHRILRVVRADLGLDVAFVAHLTDTDRVLRYVDADRHDAAVHVGASDPRHESSCHDVVEGQLPELVRDPLAHPVSAALPATRRLPVGTHLSVPVRSSDGSVFGTFCCFSYEVEAAVEETALVAMRVVARVLGEHLEEYERGERSRRSRRAALQTLARSGSIAPVFQPIVRLASGEVVGAEALARFPTTGESPAGVFAEAWALGVGVDLETEAAATALAHAERLPAEWYVSVNASPVTMTSPRFLEIVEAAAARAVVVEVTEHAAVEDYGQLLRATAELSEHGVRLAIDDVGMGFSGLHHILRVAPHILKVDRALVRDVDTDPAKQALASALVTFAAETDALLVAEGIETQAELDTLCRLGVEYGQGHHLGRPRAVPGSGPTGERERRALGGGGPVVTTLGACRHDRRSRGGR